MEAGCARGRGGSTCAVRLFRRTGAVADTVDDTDQTSDRGRHGLWVFGVSAPTHGRVDDVAQAWAASVNDSGGINGHPVEVIVKDIGQEPSKALAAVKSLVEEEGVVAIVGPITGTTGSWRQYVEEKGIPVLGGVPSDATFLASDNFYLAGSPNPVITYGLAKLASEEGTTKLGVVYCSESPVCADSDALAGKSRWPMWESGTSRSRPRRPPPTTPRCAKR